MEKQNQADTTPVDRLVMPLGTKDNPHKVAPENWAENRLDYGAFCECAVCSFVGRSTFLFDYYAAGGAGSALMCETCQCGVRFSAVRPVMDQLESQGHFKARLA